MSSMQHLGKGIVRAAKNYTKGYSDVQAKVREATSNDPWGPSGTQMNELAQLSYNQDHFVEIMEMLDKRLNDKGKNWRHVFKSLTVLDYLLHAGSENVVVYFRDNIYIIKTLKEFQFIDEEGKDQGANVRQKAKDITNLLQDESRLRHERRDRANMRDRMVRGRQEDGEENESDRRRSQSVPGGGRRRNGGNREDDDLRKALEESKKTAAEEQARQRLTAEERDLQQAIRLSEEEEAKRAQAVQDANQSSLFDDAQQAQSASTNPFPLIDTSQGQSQFMQPQFTAVPQQFTSFNPYQQQAQQEAMQAEYMRQQQEWQMQQLQAQQLQQQQQQEEWMRQQQLLQLQQQQQQQQFLMPQQQPLVPQATGFGSNNPFAPSLAMSTPSLPTQLSSPGQTTSPVSFNLQGTYGQGPSSTSPPPVSHSAPPEAVRAQSVPPVKTRVDDQHSHLANLLANREDGIDTFGNWGNLR
ncbi:ENTH-domain-containing protein [Lentinus tigrinus ALCF2SS1-7]|uniref:ENTH-domain-containing protein n=1 Tax=Lentinus tigrinus ALCF2SS1-6 TaxID=1328759 RepID=A0A5C2S0D2_9APHY|nr:ENTH-domain-containing protein [Lentinus tigrinus ALCF2SS1-6]RPD71200.1 ENTH-domain-containing protein [Lentinus tigrinus ALCF2SS1-7]